MSGSNASALARAGNELKTLGSDPVRWLFLLGNRILVAAVLFGAFLGLFYALYWSGHVAFRNQTALLYLPSSLVGGNLTLVTLVISINRVIISRQLSSPGELREQISNVTEYRQDVLSPENQSVVPVTPSDFLEAILQDTRRELQRLGGMTAGSAGEAVREDVDDVVTDLTDHVDRVTRLIEESGRGRSRRSRPRSPPTTTSTSTRFGGRRADTAASSRRRRTRRSRTWSPDSRR